MRDMRTRTIIKHAQYKSLPEYIFYHEHACQIGLETKIYAKADRVTPIIDSVIRLGERVGTIRRAGVARARREPAASAAPASGPHETRCPSCGVRVVASVVGELVCECGVCFGNEIVSSDRDRLGALRADDRTTRADVESEMTAGARALESVGVSGEERARARLASATRTRVGSRRGLGGGVAHAQSIVDRSRARDEHDVSLHLDGICRRDEMKRDRVLVEMQSLFSRLNLNGEPALKRNANVCVLRVFSLSAKHATACTHRGGPCELRVLDRSRQVIARAILGHVVQEMLESAVLRETERHGRTSDASRMREISDRLGRANASANVLGRTQVQSTRVMLDIMLRPDYEPNNVCVRKPTVDAYPIREAPDADNADPNWLSTEVEHMYLAHRACLTSASKALALARTRSMRASLLRETPNELTQAFLLLHACARHLNAKAARAILFYPLVKRIMSDLQLEFGDAEMAIARLVLNVAGCE